MEYKGLVSLGGMPASIFDVSGEEHYIEYEHPTQIDFYIYATLLLISTFGSLLLACKTRLAILWRSSSK